MRVVPAVWCWSTKVSRWLKCRYLRWSGRWMIRGSPKRQEQVICLVFYSTNPFDPGWAHVCAELRPQVRQVTCRKMFKPGLVVNRATRTCQPEYSCGDLVQKCQWKKRQIINLVIVKLETCDIMHLQFYFKLKKHCYIKESSQPWNRKPALSLMFGTFPLNVLDLRFAGMFEQEEEAPVRRCKKLTKQQLNNKSDMCCENICKNWLPGIYGMLILIRYKCVKLG